MGGGGGQNYFQHCLIYGKLGSPEAQEVRHLYVNFYSGVLRKSPSTRLLVKLWGAAVGKSQNISVSFGGGSGPCILAPTIKTLRGKSFDNWNVTSASLSLPTNISYSILFGLVSSPKEIGLSPEGDSYPNKMSAALISGFSKKLWYEHRAFIQPFLDPPL